MIVLTLKLLVHRKRPIYAAILQPSLLLQVRELINSLVPCGCFWAGFNFRTIGDNTTLVALHSQVFPSVDIVFRQEMAS